MPKKLRFVLVGLGGFGEIWCSDIIPKVSDIASLVAAVDINPDTFANPVRLCGLDPEKCYTELGMAIEENHPDFIVIVTPPQFHEQAIDMALLHGCDIVCEKPYAGSMEACVRVYRKVKRTGRKMLVTMSHRMDCDKQTLEALLKSGEYGKPSYFVSRLAMTRNRTEPEKARPGHGRGACGLISECAIHQMDVVRALSGANAKTVYAHAAANPWSPDGMGFGVDNVFIDIVLENGVPAFCEHAQGNAAILNEWGRDYIRAECDKAELILDNRAIEVRSVIDTSLIRQSVPLLQGGDEVWAHSLLLRQFAEWLGGGPEPPCSLEDNLQCAAMAYAAVESCETGAPVDVQEFLRRHMAAEGDDYERGN